MARGIPLSRAQLGKTSVAAHIQIVIETTKGELLSKDGPIAGSVEVILNRPERKNALTRSLVLALDKELERLSADSAVRVIVLRGAGGAFCSGADLTTIVNAEPQDIGSRIQEFHHLITNVVNTRQPVIAVVDGPAVGFGADLALSCDMRVFSTHGYLEEGFVKIGLMPDGGGTYFMPRFAGARAFEYMALGTRLSAERCRELGIANEVAVPEHLDAILKHWLTSFTRGAPLALEQIKYAARARDRECLKGALALELAGQTQLAQSEDFKEGVRAFLEKRSPQFVGR